MRREFAPIADIPLCELDKGILNDLFDQIVLRGAPSAANHAYAALRRLLNWSIERGYIDISPLRGVSRPIKREVSRDRVRSD